jgi:hypothetical protein
LDGKAIRRAYKRGIIGRWLHGGRRSTWGMRRMTGVKEKEKIKGSQEGVNTERVIVRMRFRCRTIGPLARERVQTVKHK